MKKLLSVAVCTFVLLASSSFVFAGNLVSEMAVTKGGQHVAECAQKMDRGVSACARHTECAK